MLWVYDVGTAVAVAEEDGVQRGPDEVEGPRSAGEGFVGIM